MESGINTGKVALLGMWDHGPSPKATQFGFSLCVSGTSEVAQNVLKFLKKLQHGPMLVAASRAYRHKPVVGILGIRVGLV